MKTEERLVNVWKESFPEKVSANSAVENYNKLGKIKTTQRAVNAKDGLRRMMHDLITSGPLVRDRCA